MTQISQWILCWHWRSGPISGTIHALQSPIVPHSHYLGWKRRGELREISVIPMSPDSHSGSRYRSAKSGCCDIVALPALLAGLHFISVSDEAKSVCACALVPLLRAINVLCPFLFSSALALCLPMLHVYALLQHVLRSASPFSNICLLADCHPEKQAKNINFLISTSNYQRYTKFTSRYVLWMKNTMESVKIPLSITIDVTIQDDRQLW